MKTKRFVHTTDKIVYWFQYFLSVVMLLEGVSTAFSPLTPMGGRLGFIYHQRISLVILGVIVFVAGALLLVGQILAKKYWIGTGLLVTFGCFLFATFLESVAQRALDVPNLVAAVVSGSLYLRWRLKTLYVHPKEFREDIEELGGNR